MKIDMYKVFYELQKKHWWFVVRKNIVLDIVHCNFNKKRDLKILDIGCGCGVILNALENYGMTFGMDMSEDAIKYSKEIFNGEVSKGSLPDCIPFEKGFFNLITALDVIEHVDQDVDSLKVIRSLLISNGKAIITVPAYMFLWSKLDELNEHKRRYSLTELKLKLIQAGFTVEKISYYNTLLFPIIFAIRVLNNILNRDGFSDLDMPNKYLNYILSKIFNTEKYLLRFTNFSFGVSILAVVRK